LEQTKGEETMIRRTYKINVVVKKLEKGIKYYPVKTLIQLNGKVRNE